MFLSDRESSPAHLTSDPEQCPMALCISQQPLRYSLVSKATAQRIRTLEKIIGEDPGERGIQALFVQDELLKSSLSLSHASSVLITTGFPTHFKHDPPEENDGPPGAIAMAATLQALGKEVAIVTDHRALEMNIRIMKDAVEKGVIKTAVPVLSFQDSGPDSARHFLLHDGDPKRPRFDHLVAIERSGRAADGNYYNMREVNIKHLVDPIDNLFTTAAEIPGINTTGIGDGGNELGMGKVKEAVSAYMPNGKLIACDVAADFAITAGRPRPLPPHVASTSPDPAYPHHFAPSLKPHFPVSSMALPMAGDHLTQDPLHTHNPQPLFSWLSKAFTGL
ncbi:hypothetical protein JZ751_002431 [Albula glossodonta]|uniref:D-glutamate cyclase-like C-terminal domain-containing protein n=1 Tax=Albula glossodonta TaxID=121402 RepID=A0A8T2N808_9TELE|nr:hypothetical protein JZ751_002431 [Albula glossodonta]